MAYGLNLPQVVFKGLNDHYIKGCKFEVADVNKSEIFKKIVESIESSNRACEAGKGDYSMLMAGIFKQTMPESIKEKFIDNGWAVNNLPRNPYC